MERSVAPGLFDERRPEEDEKNARHEGDPGRQQDARMRRRMAFMVPAEQAVCWTETSKAFRSSPRWPGAKYSAIRKASAAIVPKPQRPLCITWYHAG